jgi:hypothetical protein
MDGDDRISNFKMGSGGDVLDVSDLLDITNSQIRLSGLNNNNDTLITLLSFGAPSDVGIINSVTITLTGVNFNDINIIDFLASDNIIM